MQNELNTNTHNYVLTCQSGLESLVRRECERLHLTDIIVTDRLISCSGTTEHMYELLVWSRFANRVYIELTHAKIEDFDTLYDTLNGLNWTDYLTGKERIIIEAASTRSTLEHTPTIQSVSQKAIFSTIHTPNTTNGVEVHILILIIDNQAHILIDITGDPLHKRGYRREAGDAPIKENLAAALIAFSGWRHSTPLLDPMCGSGTIVIEAAMMARNIAPGLGRHFRIEELHFHDSTLLDHVKNNATSRIYPSGKYLITGSDIDPEMIQIAKGNAKRAGVENDIIFSVSDYIENPKLGIQDTILSGAQNLASGVVITNPPYGDRLQHRQIESIYQKLIKDITTQGGGFITSYDIGKNQLSNKKLLNGGMECRFWYQKLDQTRV